MIIDKLENGTYYYSLGARIQKALQFLRDSNLAELEIGKYHIEDNDIYAMVSEYDSKLMEGVLWEAHKRYIDIQYIIKGSEKIGYTNVENLETTVEYNETKDIYFGTASGDFVTVQEGMFMILAPQDGHMPGICCEKPGRVKKIVIKVLAE
jgi:YhcH/YjgK/YiaL family protein